MVTAQNLIIKNKWWGDNKFKIRETNFPKRDLYPIIIDNLDHTLILNIVGLRRVGKSTILKQVIGHLQDKGIDPLKIFYFLFDYSHQIQKSEFLDEVLSVYFKDILNNPTLEFKEDEVIYILLDEIQYIKDWQSILKRYYDLSSKQIKFIVTGSQSILLKDKSRESLAGRVFDFYLPPMSFREFLRINKENVETIENYDLFNLNDKYRELVLYNSYHSKDIIKLTHEYIITGEFPEIREIPDSDRRYEYIVESVMGKVIEDCINIFDIEKTDEFKLITMQLLNSVGSLFELSNIGREIAISDKTLDIYMMYLKDAYIFEVLYKYHKSIIKKGRILKKLYTPCINFVCASNHYTEAHFDEVPQAFGKIIENVIYNVLKQKYDENSLTDTLSFWRQGQHEIDFIVLKKEKQLAIEVKFSNEIHNKDLAALVNYIMEKNLEYGIVITKDEISRKNISDKIIYFIPYYLILMMI